MNPTRPKYFLIWTLTAFLVLCPGRSALAQNLLVTLTPLEVRQPGASDQAVGFVSLPSSKTGVDFENRLPENLAAVNQILLNGSGVAVGDFDRDGLEDLYFCQLVGPNALYRNLGGFEFEEVAAKVGLDLPRQFSTGALFEDFTGDGWLDLLVNGIQAGSKLFVNDQKGGWILKEDSGLDRTSAAHSAAAADFDRDGDLDLYVTHYRNETVRDRPIRVPLRNENGKIIIPPPHDERFDLLIDGPGQGSLIELGTADRFYENLGGGKFRAISWTDGAFLDAEGRPIKSAPLDWGLAVAFRDINQDGWPDLYVCNDFTSPDRIWINQKDGRFQELPSNALSKTSWASMAVDFADLDRDGWDDFFVADMLSPDPVRRLTQTGNMSRPVTDYDRAINRPQIMRNTLQWNRGNGTYSEIAAWSGVSASEWTWSAIFCDVDLDGYEDLLIANGHGYDILDADAVRAVGELNAESNNRRRRTPMELYPKLKVPNLIFRNQGNLKFQSVGEDWGWNEPTVTHGIALADLDRDGDLDFIGNNLNQAASVYENVSGNKRIAVRLKGSPSNSQAIGSRVELKVGNRIQSDEIQSGGHYLSNSSTLCVFAVPESEELFSSTGRLTVRWPNGAVSKYESLKANTLIEIQQPPKSSSDISVDPFYPTQSKTTKSDTPNWKFQLQTNPADLQGAQWKTRPANAPAYPLHGLAMEDRQSGVPVWIEDWNGDGWPDICFLNADASALSLQVWINLEGSGFRGTTVDINGLDLNSKWSHLSLVLALTRGSSGEINLQRDLKSDWMLVLQDPSSKDQTMWVNAKRNGAALQIGDFSKITPGSPGPSAHLPWKNGLKPIILSSQDPDGNKPDLFYLYELNDKKGKAIWKEIQLPLPIHGATSIKAGDLNGNGSIELVIASPWSPVRIFQLQATKDPTSIQAVHQVEWDSKSGWWNSVHWIPGSNPNSANEIIAWNWGFNMEWDVYHPAEILRLEGDLPGSQNPITLTGFKAQPDLKTTRLWTTWNDVQMVWPRWGDIFPKVSPFAESSMELVGSRLKSQGIEWRRLLKAESGSHWSANLTESKRSITLPEELNWGPVFHMAPWISKDHQQFSHLYFLARNHELGWMDPPRQDAGRGITILYRSSDSNKWHYTELESDLPDPTLPTRAILPADFSRDGIPDLLILEQNGQLHWATGRR